MYHRKQKGRCSMQRLVPVVGLEPTRVSPTDFESVTSAIPSHRQWNTQSVYRNSDRMSRKSPLGRLELRKQINIIVACCAARVLYTLIAAHFALPAGRQDFKPDHFAGKQQNKKHRTDDQRQIEKLLFDVLKNKNRGYYSMGRQICKARLYYNYIKV